MRGKLGRVLRIARRHLRIQSAPAYHKACRARLSDKSQEFAEFLALVVRVEVEDFSERVVVRPLLEEFFAVGCRVAFYQVLKLRQICCEQESPSHRDFQQRMRRGLCRLVPCFPPRRKFFLRRFSEMGKKDATAKSSSSKTKSPASKAAANGKVCSSLLGFFSACLDEHLLYSPSPRPLRLRHRPRTAMTLGRTRTTTRRSRQRRH